MLRTGNRRFKITPFATINTDFDAQFMRFKRLINLLTSTEVTPKLCSDQETYGSCWLCWLDRPSVLWEKEHGSPKLWPTVQLRSHSNQFGAQSPSTARIFNSSFSARFRLSNIARGPAQVRIVERVGRPGVSCSQEWRSKAERFTANPGATNFRVWRSATRSCHRLIATFGRCVLLLIAIAQSKIGKCLQHWLIVHEAIEDLCYWNILKRRSQLSNEKALFV